MAYRETVRVVAHKAGVRERLLAGAKALVAGGGFAAVSMAAVAQTAGVATGTVYRYFDSKAELLAEVFRVCSGREVEVMAQTHRQPGTPASRFVRGIEVWASRAIAGRTLAYALLAEPALPEVAIERLRYRRAYVDLLSQLLREGTQTGDFVVDDIEVTAAGLVGAMAEALVGPLAPSDEDLSIHAPRIVRSLSRFCVRAVGATP